MRRLLLSLFFVVFYVSANSQTKNEIYKSTIWLKLSALDTVNTSRMREDNKVLNYHLPLNLKQSKTAKKFTSVINKESSFFVVYKTTDAVESDLLLLQNGIFKATLTNRKLVSDKEEIFTKTKPEFGALISHIFNKQSLTSRKKGSLSISDNLYNDKEGKNQLYELVYIPSVLNGKEKNSAESYLAIKYGISLLGDRHYTNSSGDTIWNFKVNEKYNQRVTGIGRDDTFSLYQKQSGNHTKDGLYIGLDKIKTLNYQNKSVIEDKTFLLWGDNNLKTSLAGKSAALAKMSRIWKAEKLSVPGKVLTTQVIINKKQMLLDRTNTKDDFIWIAMDTISSGENIDYDKSIYIKASSENDSIITFNNIKWSTAQTLFTFVKAPEFFVDYKITAPTCSATIADGKADIKIVGGTAPYEFKLTSANFAKGGTTQENSLAVEGLTSGTYNLLVSDSNGKSYTATFLIDPFVNSEITIASQWLLDKGAVVKITPQYNGSEALIYVWLLNDRVISTQKEFTADIPADYILEVTNSSGCSKQLPFSVVEKVMNTGENFVVYPNPTKANELFTIKGSSKKPSKTTLTITDMNGKQIIYKDLGVVQDFTYSNRLLQSATYIVVITSDEEQHTRKLIIY